MLFANPGKYNPCGIYTRGHIILFTITVIGIIIAVKNTNKKYKENNNQYDNNNFQSEKSTKSNYITKITKRCMIIIWGLEIIKVVFNLAVGNVRKINTYVPLYYCSILLYAGILALSSNRHLKRAGTTFIKTGAIVAGIVFIISPVTSLSEYPAFHFISIHSFIYHGIMIYLGIIYNKKDSEQLERKDIFYYASLIFLVCMIAYIINNIFGSNLMFISESLPKSFIELIYVTFPKFFTPIMIIGQMTLPFYIVYIILKIQKRVYKTLKEY